MSEKFQLNDEGLLFSGSRHFDLKYLTGHTNHLENALWGITDTTHHVSSTLVCTKDYSLSDAASITDYDPFGHLIGAFFFKTSAYRFGFNGKENDNEKGFQDYGMRLYDKRLGRFISVDPIFSKYPMLSTYQFASNSSIIGIDQDGLEFENAIARMKAKIFGVDALKIKRVDDGWGRVQSQLYTLKTHGTSAEFTKLKEMMLNSPQSITNNFYAKYAPVQKAKGNTLSPGDEIGIDIKFGQVPVAFKIYVRVMDVQSTGNSFKMTFATLEGHTDAGYVTFSGSFDAKTGVLTFQVFNETRENHGLGYVTFTGRPSQQDQWEDVMGNVRIFLGKEKNDVNIQENIQEFKYDENGAMGKGECTKSETECIDE